MLRTRLERLVLNNINPHIPLSPTQHGLGHTPHKPNTKHHRRLQSPKPSTQNTNSRHRHKQRLRHSHTPFNSDIYLNLKNGLPITSPADKHTQNTTASLPQQDTSQTESHNAPYFYQNLSTFTCTTSQPPKTQTRPSCHTPMTLAPCFNITNRKQQQLIYKHIL